MGIIACPLFRGEQFDSSLCKLFNFEKLLTFAAEIGHLSDNDLASSMSTMWGRETSAFGTQNYGDRPICSQWDQLHLKYVV